MAQAIYDANGQYKGYSQTSPSGVTTTYDMQGWSIGSSQMIIGRLTTTHLMEHIKAPIQPPLQLSNPIQALTLQDRHRKQL